MKNITIARNNDLLRNASRILEESRRNGEFIKIGALVDLAISSRPQAHYLSFDRALDIVRLYRRHGSGAFSKAILAAQAAEISEQVDRTMARNCRLSVPQALTFVINFCRPERFRISRDLAARIIRRHFAMGLLCTDTNRFKLLNA